MHGLLLTQLIEHDVLLCKQPLDALWIKDGLLPLLASARLLLTLVGALLTLACLELLVRLLGGGIEQRGLTVTLGRSRARVQLLLRTSLLVLLDVLGIDEFVAVQDLLIERVLVQVAPIPDVCEDASLRIVVSENRPVQRLPVLNVIKSLDEGL